MWIKNLVKPTRNPKEPKVMINPDITSSKFGGGAPSKLREFETDLVFELWESFDYRHLTIDIYLLFGLLLKRNFVLFLGKDFLCKLVKKLK